MHSFFAAILLSICPAGSLPTEQLDSTEVSRLGFDPGRGVAWALLSPDTAGPDRVLLRDGTEFARIDTARARALLDARPHWNPPPLPDLDRLRSWTRPPEGLELSWTFRRSRSSHSSPIDRNLIGATFDQPWSDWASLGFTAGVERTYSSFPLDSVSPSPGRVWWPWWGGRACIRSVCWEVRASQHPIPDELWTQEKMDSLVPSREEGGRTRSWKTPPPASKQNWENIWSARIGVVEWRTSVDEARWRGAVHELSVSPLGGGLLRWGLLAGVNDDRAWTGIEAGVAPRRFALARGAGLESSPATVAFRFADANCFSFEVRTALVLLPPWSLP